MPAPATSFLGREAELAEVLALLRTRRLVTITGPGGVGKTRLALRAAGELVDTTVDGVWWIDLTSVGGSTVLADAVLRALDDQPAGQLDPRGARPAAPEERLKRFLANRDLILVLDNCEHLSDAVGQLAGTILASAPRVRVLVTSQRSLNIAGETLWSAPPLPVPPQDAELSATDALGYAAVRLFNDRAGAATGHNLEGEETAVTKICRTLEGMPLAIELAAARTRLLPPRQLLSRLNDRFALLTGGSSTAPERQRTLRAVVDWSWRLLTSDERVLLRRLAVFAGGARLDAVEQVCVDASIPVEGVIDLVAGLVDKSLVTVAAADGEARYTMLDTIQAHAAEELAKAGEDGPVRAAHARYYADLAAAAAAHLHGPDQLEWLRRLTAERANSRSAIENADAQHDGKTALRLAGALSQYWWLTGDSTEGHRLTTLALRAADQDPSPDRAAALTFLAWLELRDLRGSQLERLLEEAVACYQAIGDPDGAALPTAMLAEHLRRVGELPRSRALVAQTSAAAGWPAAVAQLHSGGTAGMSGDLLEAERLLTTALQHFRDLGDRWGQAEPSPTLAGWPRFTVTTRQPCRGTIRPPN